MSQAEKRDYLNILIISPHGMYNNYSFSFVHNQAKAYIRQGHRVRAVIPLAVGKRSNEGRCMGPPVEIFEKDGVEICYVRHLSLSNFGAKWFNTSSCQAALSLLLPKVLRDFRPDVIHAHCIGFGGEIGDYLQRKLHIPLVITTHGSDTNTALEQGEGEKLKRICDHADAVVACSAVLANNLRRCGTVAPIQYIYNGFAVEYVKACEKTPRRIIQVCSLSPSKHVELTIQAMSQLKSSYPDISLVIVGDGPERKSLESLCAELGVEESVRFLGQLSNSTAMEEMAKSQVFVMPSYPEGLGIVYLEAMASGCVTIGTQGEGIDGVIVNEENGFLVPRDDVDAIVDTVDRCFRDESLTHRIADAGRATAMSMTWENNAKQYIDLFCELRREQQGTCGV